MPQPLSGVRSNAEVRIGNLGDYPFRRHPDLAHLVAEVIASWANVESFMLNLFIELMGGPKDKAATVFLALVTHGTKSAAITAIAENTLSEDHNKLLKVILQLQKTNEKARDKIAHGIWGDSRQLPDALLLVDSKELIRIYDEPRLDPFGPPEQFAQAFRAYFDDPLHALRDHIYVYRRNDFLQIISANERLAGFGMKYRFLLMQHPSNQDNQLYDQLCTEPEIRERLDRLA